MNGRRRFYGDILDYYFLLNLRKVNRQNLFLLIFEYH